MYNNIGHVGIKLHVVLNPEVQFVVPFYGPELVPRMVHVPILGVVL